MFTHIYMYAVYIYKYVVCEYLYVWLYALLHTYVHSERKGGSVVYFHTYIYVCCIYIYACRV